jgi:hypothetical protein
MIGKDDKHKDTAEGNKKRRKTKEERAEWHYGLDNASTTPEVVTV